MPLTPKDKEIVQTIERFFDTNNIYYEFNNSLDKNRIDFYIPSCRLHFEIVKLDWALAKSQHDHRWHVKTRALLEKKLKDYLFFYEDEFRNKKDLIFSFLKHRLNLVEKIYARDCYVKQITKKLGCEFLDQNHLLGSFSKGKCLGLFYGTDLVGVLQFQVYKRMAMLQRFSYQTGAVVVGGLQKMIKFLTTHSPIQKMSAILDLRYSHGDGLERAGFTNVGDTLSWYESPLGRISGFGLVKYELVTGHEKQPKRKRK